MKPEMVALFLHIDLDEPDAEIIKELETCDCEAYLDPEHGGYWCGKKGITLFDSSKSFRQYYSWPEFIKVLRSAGQTSLFGEEETL